MCPTVGAHPGSLKPPCRARRQERALGFVQARGARGEGLTLFCPSSYGDDDNAAWPLLVTG